MNTLNFSSLSLIGIPVVSHLFVQRTKMWIKCAKFVSLVSGKIVPIVQMYFIILPIFHGRQCTQIQDYLILSPNFFLSPRPLKRESWIFLLLGQVETVELGLYHLSFVSLSGSASNQYKSSICSIINMKWLPNSFHFRRHILGCGNLFGDYHLFLLGAIKVLPRQQRCICWVVLCPKLSFSAVFSLYLFRHLLLSYSKGAKELLLLLNCKFNAITCVPRMKSSKLRAAETKSKYNCQELLFFFFFFV